MMKNNVSALASIATRHVATARVHIERIIKRVKSFNFLLELFHLHVNHTLPR